MSVENRPNNHKLIRILTAAGILGGTGAVVVGKVMLDELSKAKPAVSAEFIPSPISTITINGERYVTAPTATVGPTETPPPSATASPTKKAESTATSFPTTSPTVAPTIAPAFTATVVKESPVEKAFKAGYLELKDGEDWKNYFEEVSAEEAKELLEKANANVTEPKEVKFLFPINPKDAPNLIAETVHYNTPMGERTAIGIKGFSAGREVFSTAYGDATLLMSAAVGNVPIIYVKINAGDLHFGISANREDSTSTLPVKKEVPITPSSSLFFVGTNKPVGFFPGEQQLIIQVYGKDLKNIGSIKQFLTKNGKLLIVGK